MEIYKKATTRPTAPATAAKPSPPPTREDIAALFDVVVTAAGAELTGVDAEVMVTGPTLVGAKVKLAVGVVMTGTAVVRAVSVAMEPVAVELEVLELFVFVVFVSVPLEEAVNDTFGVAAADEVESTMEGKVSVLP